MNESISALAPTDRTRPAALIYLPALVLALTLAGVGFAIQGQIGFDLADEGYLWYGVQRVMAGEVPLRDFSAYDPGRYYLAAALMGLAGDNGVVALRVVSTVLQALGVFVAVVLVGRASQRPRLWLLGVAAVVLAAWMFELYKQYDKTTAIVLVGALSLMTGQASRRRFFIAGAAIGLAAIIGRNHGLYGFVGGLLVLIYLSVRRHQGGFRLRLPEGTPYWLAGVVAGYSPVLLMALLVPGFGGALVDSVTMIFEYGATNLALPTPWPWRINPQGLPVHEALRLMLVGLLFVSLAMACVAGIVLLGWFRFKGRELPPLLVGAICLIPGYAHYAFSRADEYHLAIGILPLLMVLLCGLAIAGKRVAVLASAVLVTISLWVTYPRHPVVEECRAQSFVSGCTATMIGSDTLLIRSNIAQMIRVIQKWASETPPDRNLLVLPLWPGIYPALGAVSPVWELYAVIPRSAAFQRQEIARIREARPGMILVNNIAVDGRPELTYSNTHPLITRYIVENYVEVSRLGVYHLFRPPELAAPAGR